jgi:cellulose synthase/poly-beta-1,6-N-acetylglucosamine synthase-like glycosyltransferase
MGAFLVVFAILSAIILAFHIALAAGLLIDFRRERRVRRGPALPFAPDRAVLSRAEVVVAVRDEESTLPRLLKSLRAQTLEGCLFLFVDDRSTDGTAQLLDDFCTSVGARARVIHNRAEPIGLTGKQAALDLAFAEVKGDILLFTDGDCLLPPAWAEEMLLHFLDAKVGVVLGRIELVEGASFLQRFQAFEQPLLNQYNFGSVGIGIPTGCFGNNMGVRASAVKEAGGFRTLGYSVTEDAMLLDALCRRNGWEVKTCTSSRSAATTIPKADWKEYINQHIRWNAGGLFSADVVTRVSFIFVVLIYLVGSLLVLPLGFVDWRVPVLSLNSFLSIGLLALAGGFYDGKRKGPYFLRLLPYLFFFGFFYSFVTLRALAQRSFVWKGASLSAVISPGKTHSPPGPGSLRR